ncbi:hypothetical protein ACFT2C_04290 [Promicromonospora sp. NPDC057138]|uniref:hypothetical protein n=1 Tax=Promicromonospora sp. NPDC057138 TaxID=3346031 RepID=UPI003625D23E
MTTFHNLSSVGDSPISAAEIEAAYEQQRADFEVWRERTARDQQAEVDAALTAGAEFLLNRPDSGDRRVHTLTCPHVRRKLDRMAEWAEARWHPQGGVFPKPADIQVLTRKELESLGKRYKRCQICGPDVVEAPKRKRQDAILAMSLAEHHAGIPIEGPNGQELGDFISAEPQIVVTTSTGTHVLPARSTVRLRFND